MCDYSLHALATRPAKAGETLISTTFRGTSTRGFASESEPTVAVCMMPGTELAFEQNVKYDNRWIWTRTTGFRVGKGQRATVLQLPVVHPVTGRRMTEAGAVPAASASAG